MTHYPHEFLGEISLHGVGKSRVITYKVLFMPPHFETILPFAQFPRLRVEGEIAEVPVRGAWMPVGDGRRYFIVSPAIKASTGFDVGDTVEMRFRVDDQDHVDVPPALQAALNDEPQLLEKWLLLSAGKKRMFSHHVASAKSPATEQRRISEALAALGQGLSVRDFQRGRRTNPDADPAADD
jgi:hypothetical protein